MFVVHFFREDKRKKALRGGLSETDSERSRGDRDSTEIKAVQTLHLTKPPPEKGILKKHPRSTEKQQRTKSRDLEKVGGKKESGVKAGLEVEGERNKNADGEEQRALLQSGEGCTSGDSAAESRQTNCPADKWSSDDGLDFIDDRNEDDSSSNSVCYCGDDDKSVEDLDEKARPALLPITTSRSEPSQPTLFVTAKVDEREMIRKNYMDLLEQFNKFDEQFNSVLSQTSISPPNDLSTANSEHLQLKDSSKNALFKQNEKGILPQTDMQELNSSSTVDIREKPSDGLPDLLHSGIRKSSPSSAKLVETTLRLRPQKQEESDSSQPKNSGQKASNSSSTTLSNPLGKPLFQSTPPISRTRPFTPFVPKTATSETFKKSICADDARVASPLEMGAMGGAKLDPISTVPYRGANSSGSPRLNRRKQGENGPNLSRSDEDSKPASAAFRPSAISLTSSSTNKQSINSATNSEGYHSDRGNGSDEAIVIREISREFPLTATPRSALAKAPPLLSSPEDIDV